MWLLRYVSSLKSVRDRRGRHHGEFLIVRSHTTCRLDSYFSTFFIPQGPESGKKEVACQSSAGSSITTGGGFSHDYTLPSWQATEVTNYINRVVSSSSAPQPGYDPSKRGYPDISVLANNYVVVANGMPYVGM